jgi:hypothetical protein
MMTTTTRLTVTLLTLLLCVQLIASPCFKTTEQEDLWVRRNIDRLITKARAAYEDEAGQPAYVRTLTEISTTLKQCRLTEDSHFVSRYSDFGEWIRVLSLDQQTDHELGFEISDRTYFERTRAFVTIPDFLLRPEFLQSVKRFQTLSKAKALLRAINATRPKDQQLLFFSYESRHLGTPDRDNSYRRLLIVVPGDPQQNIPEKWVQFGIPDPGMRIPIRNVSVVAVVAGPDKTTNTYFKDYFRTYRRDGSVTVKGRWELGEGDDNCVKCHKSGVLPIFPVAGSVAHDEKTVVEAVNRRFLTYGAPRFGGYLDTTKFGPGLGSYSTGCSECHQPNGLGSLNWPMDSVLISSFVEGGRMPLGSKLKEWESNKLYEELIDDYFSIDKTRPGILKTWLLNGDTHQPKRDVVISTTSRY